MATVEKVEKTAEVVLRLSELEALALAARIAEGDTSADDREEIAKYFPNLAHKLEEEDPHIIYHIYDALTDVVGEEDIEEGE